ncbi:MAG: NAD(P)/FAD-dependent oxidoreductase [Candidatus Scalinduaceae bacterium]
MKKNLCLKDGSRIAIIGGGPAGSFFANFALKHAKKLGWNISVTIFEGRDFSQCGPKGCNMSAAVIARTLHGKLIKDGIELPEYVIRQKIKGYYFQSKGYGIELHRPESNENIKILAVYRGNGPFHSTHAGNISFDDFMLRHVIEQGADVIHEPVQDITLPSDARTPVKLAYGRRGSLNEIKADLVVGAFGINSTTVDKIKRLGFGYEPPKTIKTFQMEMPLSDSYIRESFKDNIYVFAIGLKPFRFASMVPKRNYVTISLVGSKDLSKENLFDFLNHPVIRDRLPSDWKMPDKFCMCMPKISLTHAKRPYTNRFVIVGDASIARIYKNGLESAYITSQLAVQTAFEKGISGEDFNRYYYKPARKLLAMDNLFGAIIVRFSDFVTRRAWLVTARLSYVANRKGSWMANHLNKMLWNMVTGDAPYRRIFLQAFNPVFQIRLIPVTIKAFIIHILGKIKKK